MILPVENAAESNIESKASLSLSLKEYIYICSTTST